MHLQNYQVHCKYLVEYACACLHMGLCKICVRLRIREAFMGEALLLLLIGFQMRALTQHYILVRIERVV